MHFFVWDWVQVNIERGNKDGKSKMTSKHQNLSSQMLSILFLEAHAFAKSLSLKVVKNGGSVKGEPGEKPGRPQFVPAHPDGIYKIKGWQGWKHWLGTADKGLYVQQQESAAVNEPSSIPATEEISPVSNIEVTIPSVGRGYKKPLPTTLPKD